MHGLTCACAYDNSRTHVCQIFRLCVSCICAHGACVCIAARPSCSCVLFLASTLCFDYAATQPLVFLTIQVSKLAHLLDDLRSRCTCVWACSHVLICACMRIWIEVGVHVRTRICAYSLRIRITVFICVCMYVCVSIDRSIYLSIYLSVYLSVCLSICLSIYLSIYLSM